MLVVPPYPTVAVARGKVARFMPTIGPVIVVRLMVVGRGGIVWQPAQKPRFVLINLFACLRVVITVNAFPNAFGFREQRHILTDWCQCGHEGSLVVKLSG